MSCSLSVAFKPTRALLVSFPSSPLSCSLSISVTFKPTRALDASFPSSSFSAIHACGVTLSMHNGGSCSYRSTMRNEHAQQVNHVFFRRACPLCSTRTDGHTNKRTHGQTNFRRTIKCGARSRSPPITQLHSNSYL